MSAWKPFTIGNDIYGINFKKLDHEIKILLSNFKTIWWKELSNEEILVQFKEFNPTFDVNESEAVDFIVKIIESIDSSEVDCNVSETNFQLNITSNFIKFKAKYNFNYVNGNEQMFTDEVTFPLIYTVKYLEDQQDMLCTLLQRKDRELEEYKLEHGNISRDDLITEKFDPSKLDLPNEKLILKVFGKSKLFWEAFISSQGLHDIKLNEIKKDPWNHTKKKKRTVYSSKTTKLRKLQYKAE